MFLISPGLWGGIDKGNVFWGIFLFFFGGLAMSSGVGHQKEK
jgi:hypothetical protein